MRPIIQRAALALTLASGSFPVAAHAAGAVPPPDAKEFARVLSDKTIFGKDLPAVLMVLGGFRKAGEKRLLFFPERAVGENHYPRMGEAKKSEEELGIETLEPPRAVKPEFAPLLKSAPKTQLKTQVIAKFADDQSIRLALTGKPLQLLKPGLKIADVLKRLGPAERREDVALPVPSERRPTLFRVYRYLGGAIGFVESDHAPKSGVVDRVLVDLPAVEAAFFAGGEGK